MGTVSRQNPREFWNARARTFPRFEEGEENYEAGMLRRAREHGVSFAGKHILDVGCGSGMYTLRLAREAAWVTAVDISDEMLRLLREDAQAQGIRNISYLRSGWDEFVAEGAFDLVFASMTPAVESEAGKKKLTMFPGAHVVFMGFAERMCSDVMSGLHEHYGVPPRLFNSAQDMRAWLEAGGVPYTALPVRGRWAVSRTRDAMLDSCLTALRDFGITPDPDYVARHMEAFRDTSGNYVERTDYTVEMILWQNR